MKNTNTKSLKVFKVVMIIYTAVILVLCGITLYGWFFSETRESSINPAFLASSSACYCGCAALYEEEKKKAAKKEEN